MFSPKIKLFIIIALSIFVLLMIGFILSSILTKKTVYMQIHDKGPIEILYEFVSNVITEILPEKITDDDKKSISQYPLHTKITSTVFWVGEKAGDDNDDIANSSSAWDEAWREHFGGTDDPRERNGFFPKKFVPKENSFYVALPFNDFDANGERKTEAGKYIPWAKERIWKENESICKNRWVKILKNDKTAYAQWEDVGPFKENDYSYVFGNEKPLNKINQHAGIDVSPAVRDFLRLEDIDQVDWQFINSADVPDGDWKKTITTSQTYWK